MLNLFRLKALHARAGALNGKTFNMVQFGPDGWKKNGPVGAPTPTGPGSMESASVRNEAVVRQARRPDVGPAAERLPVVVADLRQPGVLVSSRGQGRAGQPRLAVRLRRVSAGRPGRGPG